MKRFKAISVFLFVVLVVVLPMYELADYGEHWPHDGDIAVPLLVLLALLGFAYICRTLISLSLVFLRHGFEVVFAIRIERTLIRKLLCAPLTVFLICCDFRI